MNVVLLCAGFGTRMYPLTWETPKALLEVAGKPVLDHFIEQILRLHGLDDIYLVSNGRHFGQFERWAARWRADWPGVSLSVVNNGVMENENRLGSIGDLVLGLQHTGTDKPVMIAGGDNIFRFSFQPLVEQFQQTGRNYYIALHETDMKRLQRTGVLDVDEEGKILSLAEKPEEPASHWACPPVYFLQEDALKLVTPFREDNPEKDSLGNLGGHLVGKVDVFAFRLHAVRFDIGSIEDYERANEVLRREPVIL